MKKLFYYICIGIVFSIVLASTYPFLLTGYARFFTIKNASKGADALVVLTGSRGTMINRLPHALNLYHEGYASRILIPSERIPNQSLQTIYKNNWDEAHTIILHMQDSAKLESIPSTKGGATSIFDEAYDVRQYSMQHNFHHLIIVTDKHMTRRALYAFEKVFKETGVKIEVSGASNDYFNEQTWWKSDAGISAYLVEGITLIIYWWS